MGQLIVVKISSCALTATISLKLWHGLNMKPLFLGVDSVDGVNIVVNIRYQHSQSAVLASDAMCDALGVRVLQGTCHLGLWDLGSLAVLQSAK